MGFESPARDYEVNDIDLPNYLVPHPLATYFVRVTDNGMDRFHIPQNALLVIDRTYKPTHNKIVIVNVNGERNIRKLIKAPRAWVLEAGTGKPLIITREMTVQFLAWSLKSLSNRKKQTMIAIVDSNNFYTSCERVFEKLPCI